VKTNIIYNEDCLEGLKSLPDNSVDLVLTDPPYGIGYEYNQYEDTLENLQFIIKNILPEIRRVSKLVLLFCNHKNLFEFPKSDWVCSYSWNTTASYCPFGVCQWQPIIAYGKDIKGFGSINGIIKSDHIRINGGGGVGFMRKEKDVKKHPCPKPLNIIKLLVRRFSNENDVVLDPFMGSGTTAIACLELNRKYIGFELDKEYYKLAQERIDIYNSQLKLPLGVS
jgi:site-specific DNA-methyltransferase (adenine-specific)